ncbi:MAG TPA: HD-GYP domain-containing protein, partial [Ilumatobacteraceae bacterium]|nr:HD-GYP domain-containing protein [Ilumatobacteraceae bacterium]
MTFVRRWILIAVLLLVPMGVLALLRVIPAIDRRIYSADAHLVVVSAIAACALIVASMAAVAASRVPQPGVVWLGLGCMAVGVFMLGHGLLTPGVFGQPKNRWIGRLPYAAIASFALCLYIGGRRPDRGINRWVSHHPVSTLLVPTVAATVTVAALVADPLRFGGAAPFAHENAILAVLSTLILILLASVIWTHGHRWQLGHDTVQLAILLAAAMSVAAIFSFEHGRFTQVSWWDYHAYLLAGFGAAVYAVVLRRHEQQTVSELLATTFDDDPFAHIVQGYPEALCTLVRAVEIKDAYTHGHSQRTAQLAVELGLQMALPPDRLRILARGAFLHDIGKIAIPDHILNKPGRLTPAERLVVETHAQLGYELASNAPSLREVLEVILHHHERMDGQGYPGRLVGREIPFEARVVAVADVWDALTSDRPYRSGWEPPMALAHIVDGRTSHFDPLVVDALVQWAAGRGITAELHAGRADEAWRAGETCHEADPAREAVAV